MMNDSAVQAVAKAVRSLSMDAIQAANSGHPGLPLGLAELGALLFGEIMNLQPSDPMWPNRDRLVLSAGHGSMLLYSLLHLAGYDISLDDVKQFRQLDSRTPGHPEWGHTSGVETTTGPLGQGFANAVGMAMAETMEAARWNTADAKIVDHYTYCIAGDGCMMEGITSEAASLAGHQKLGKLIVFYDDNKISIDGTTDITFTEDVQARFRAYGWHVQSGDAYDVQGLRAMVQEAKNVNDQPSLIAVRSIIGKGSPNKAGTPKAHGAALGAEEVVAAKRELGLPEDQQFFVPEEARAFFASRQEEWNAVYQQWAEQMGAWSEKNQDLREQWEAFQSGRPMGNPVFQQYSQGESVATRAAGQEALQALAAVYPNLVGGSADLAESNKTKVPGQEDFSPASRAGRSINFGVREHAMGAITNGIILHGGFRAFCATFLVFADYLRPAVRLAALMGIPSVFVCTHDSIFVGEDGPTHQPVEHVASLRVIPNVHVYRPADAQETQEAWKMALERRDGPACLVLTRQGLPVFAKHDANWRESMRKGAYIAQEPESGPELIVVATGSEVSLAIEAAAASSKKVRIVSMSSRELFFQQPAAFRQQILPAGIPVLVAEAGVSQGWEVCTGGDSGKVFSIDRFGMSGPGAEVAKAMGFTAENLTNLIDSQ